MIDPDSDLELYDVKISKENDEFFQRIAAKHQDLFDETPEDGAWLHRPSGTSLVSLAAPPAAVEAILQVIVDVWHAEALDVGGHRFVELIDDLEIVPRDDSAVPDPLRN